MKIIDGYTGVAHVTSTEVAAYNEGITGEGDFVLPVGDQLAATQISNTEIQIGTGIALVGGIRCGNVGETASAIIQAGTVGAWRHDLIGILYERDADTLEESCTLTTLTGENGTQADAADPEYTSGDIITGALERFMPLYRVIIDDSAAIDSITQLFTTPQAQATIPRQADYIVEEGTSGNWTYRKWASGIGECWATEDQNIAVTTSGAAYGGYRSTGTVFSDFPFTFTDVPVLSIAATGTAGAWINNTAGTNEAHAYVFMSAGASLSSRTMTFRIYAIGNWK